MTTMTTPLDELLPVDDDLRQIIDCCQRMKDILDKNVDLLDDVGYRLRYTNVRKTVWCMELLSERELKKNDECRSRSP